MTWDSSIILRLMLFVIFSSWVTIWLLKPTEFWTRKWKKQEEKMATSALGYNGLDFLVYSFPMILFSVVGLIYLDKKHIKSRTVIISGRQGRRSFASFSRPLMVNAYIGILTGTQILASSLFILFLIWTFYIRITNDLKKMTPNKSFNLNLVSRIATRFGLLAEACLALLLLPVLRGIPIFRLIGIQFEDSVRYHIWLGNGFVFFSSLHGAGTYFIWGIKHKIEEQMWKWQSKGRIYLAGEIGFITGLIIWITALPQIRRKWFELFYYTHHLYPILLIFFLFHGGDRHFYMVFPGILLFSLDKLLRIIQSRQETCILSAQVFPCKAIELTLPKDPGLRYTPTSVLFMKIPSISRFQWHPFTVISSSSTDENTISVIVKCDGKWTKSLYNKIYSYIDSVQGKLEYIPAAIEGPYGPTTMNFFMYNNVLLVAGGVGITPFLSILEERGFNSRNRYPEKIQLIYITKKSQDICLLNTILPQILDYQMFNVRLKVFVTQERQLGMTLAELLNEVNPIKLLNFESTSSSKVIHGPESLQSVAAFTVISSAIFLLFLVLFNNFVIHQTKKPGKQKKPSSIIDFSLICSFAIAIASTALIIIITKWKRLKKESPFCSDKLSNDLKKQKLLESYCDLNQHEIHFGGRPNFQDILSNFVRESGGSGIGVFVCGSESMKLSVASACKLSYPISQKFNTGNKQNISFHSLNFTL